MVIAAMKLKDAYSLEGKLPLDCSLHEVLEAKISSQLASGLTSVYPHLCQGNKLVNRQNKGLVAFIELKL